MPRDRPAPGTPQDWLARAKSDLALARLPLPPEALYEDLCFHAQQAAEKALKAIYQHHGWTFRYTHDLKELATDLVSKGLVVPPEVDDAVVLTSFAWESRYPGLSEPVSEKNTGMPYGTLKPSWHGPKEKSAPRSLALQVPLERATVRAS